MIESGNNSLSNSKLNDFVLIVENVGKDLVRQKSSNNDYILEGVCAVFGAKNNNNRVYEKDEYLPHLQYLQEKIQKGQLVGDLDHPPSFDVTLKSASHIIQGLEYDGGDKVNIKLRILNETPNGKIARALLDGGVNLSISSRAAGQVLESSKVKLHRIFTYDLVGEPGFTEAILRKTINESLKNDFQMITESYDNLKNESFVEKEHLVNISESLDYNDNFKIYKINKPIESMFESIKTEKNNNKMADTKEFVTKESMNRYSEVVKDNFENLKSEMANQNKEDPLIKIKQQEIDLRAMDLQRKAEETKFRADQENNRAAARLEFDYDRLNQQDDQSEERLEVAREKISKK